MIQHISKEEERRLRRKFFADPVFVMSHQAIKDCRPKYTDFSPVEIWCAATEFTNVLLGLVRPDIEVDYEAEDLKEEVGKDAFFVMFVSALQLSALHKRRPVFDIMVPLAKHYIHHERYQQLFSQVRMDEQDEILAGRQLDFMKYELEEIAQEDVISEEDKTVMRDYIQKVNEIGGFYDLCSAQRILGTLNEDEKHKGEFAPELGLLNEEIYRRVAVEKMPREVIMALHAYSGNATHVDHSSNNIIQTDKGQIDPATFLELIEYFQQKQLS